VKTSGVSSWGGCLVLLLACGGGTVDAPVRTAGATVAGESESVPAAESAEAAVVEGDETRAEEAELTPLEARRRADLAEFEALMGTVAPELVERARGMDWVFERFRAWEADGFLIAEYSESGSGVDRVWSWRAHVFRDGAEVAQVSAAGLDGQYAWPVEVSPELSSPGVRAAVEARYAGAVVEGPDDVGAGWSDLFLGALQEPRSVRSGAFSLRGPLYRDDRATPGAEVLALPCGDAPLWDANLREVRAAMPEHDFAPPVLRVGPTIDARSRLFRWDEPERRRARAMASVGARGPCVAEHRWGELRLRRYALGGRNQGEAVALVHGDSARWVLETRHAVLGSHVDWLEPTAGWLIGRYESTGPGYLYERKLGMVAIRIADGAAFGIDVEGVYEGDDWQGERWVPSEGLDDSPLPRNPQGMAECLARRVEGRESADPTDADRAECERMLAKDVVIAEGALRVRRPRPEDWAGQPDEWAVIPLRRLTAMARRLSR